jgi:hypothetical protein
MGHRILARGQSVSYSMSKMLAEKAVGQACLCSTSRNSVLSPTGLALLIPLSSKQNAAMAIRINL